METEKSILIYTLFIYYFVATTVVTTAETPQVPAVLISDDWKDPDLGYLPSALHEDTIFSNNLLEKFYGQAKHLFTSKVMFRKSFTEEKIRQWKIEKKYRKLEKSFLFWTSENPAAIGKRLEQTYIPKQHDASTLYNVAGRLANIKNEAQALIKEIKVHYKDLYDQKGLKLKHKWMQFSSDANQTYINNLSCLSEKVQNTELQCQTTAERFGRIFHVSRKKSNQASDYVKKWKKRKNDKKNQKTVRARFKKNVERLLSHICRSDAQEFTENGFLIPDCEIKLSREEPLNITRSQLKHLVHILDLFTHQARCTLLDLVPDELGRDLLLILEGSDSIVVDDSSNDNNNSIVVDDSSEDNNNSIVVDDSSEDNNNSIVVDDSSDDNNSNSIVVDGSSNDKNNSLAVDYSSSDEEDLEDSS